jgi:hypothetical protein
MIGTVERDGFEGKVYQGEKGKFVAWQLAQLTTQRGNPVVVTAITGENGSPKAAAWNLQHNDRNGFLQRVLRSRVQLSRGEGGSVDMTVPGAQIQGVGYEGPLDLTLKANVAAPRDLSIALRLFADQIAGVAARGVYALLNSQEGEEAEADTEEIEELQF